MIDKRNIKIRPAVRSDSQYFHELRNRPDSLANSPSTKKVEYQSHQRWFSKKLTESDYFLGVILVDGVRAGTVRLERKRGAYSISVVIEPTFRGMGLCRASMKELHKMFSKNGVYLVAKVSRANKGSLNCFRSAGFSISNIGARFVELYRR